MKGYSKAIPKPSSIVSLLLIPSLYIALIAVHGYRFGDEDMTETLSYALFLSDSTLFPQDFYIQSLIQQPVNERLPFTLILSVFGAQLEWGCFLAHGIVTMFGLLGWYKLIRHFMNDRFMEILFFLISFYILYGIDLGGNEVYYNYLVPSTLAKAVAIWSIWALVKGKWNMFFLIIIPVTFIHPIVGIQLFLLGALSVIFNERSKFISNNRNWLSGFVIYFLTAGVWAGFLFFQDMGQEIPGTSATYADMIESRLAHHFFPSYFSKFSYILLLPLFITGLSIWRRFHRTLFIFFLFALLGMFFYYAAVEWLNIDIFIKSQWFKTSIWLKPLSVLAIIIVVSDKLSVKMPAAISILVLAGMVIVALVQINDGTFLKNKPYHFPETSYKNPEMTIAEEARSVLPKDACLVTPPYVTGFRYFSRRSLYIDYKSNLHSRKYLAEAYRRRKFIYGIDIQTRHNGKNMVVAGNDFYKKHTLDDFTDMRRLGVSHCMVESSVSLDLPLVLQNQLFKIYKL